MSGCGDAICEVVTDFFFIERGYLNANHFVYRSKAPVLVDSACVGDFRETEKLINSLGVALSAVSLIVNTHCHCDHVGGNKLIQELSGCAVAMHKIGKHFVDTRDDWAIWSRYYDFPADFFSCTTPLTDGDMVGIGEHEFQVVHTPGHSADGIVLYNAKEGVLLSSDALWEYDVPVFTLPVEGSGALFRALESLEKLEALDVRTVYPGHGGPFTDMRAAIVRSRKKIERYLNDRQEFGDDLLKKIIVYTLMLRRPVEEEGFLGQLLRTRWFGETVDLYFDGQYEAKYREIIDNFIRRGIVKREHGQLFTTVKR